MTITNLRVRSDYEEPFLPIVPGRPQLDGHQLRVIATRYWRGGEGNSPATIAADWQITQSQVIRIAMRLETEVRKRLARVAG